MRITPFTIAILRRVLVRLQNGSQEYICHAIFWAAHDIGDRTFGNISMTNEAQELAEFIEQGLQAHTFEGYLISSSYFGVEFEPENSLYLQARVLGRQAWIERLLYLIEGHYAIEILPNGIWFSRDGTMMTEYGKRSIFDDIDK